MSAANVLAQIDGIKASVDNIPILKFLMSLYQIKLAEQDDGYLSDQKTFVSNLVQNLSQDHPLGYAGTAGRSFTLLTDFDAHRTELTLSSGALADAGIYDPGAGNKYVVAWLTWSSDNVTGINTAFYAIQVKDNASGSNIGGASAGQIHRDADKFWILYAHDTNAEVLTVDVAGGKASEHLHFITAGGYI